MQHLDLFELTPPFYYFAPHRIVNRDHAARLSALRRAPPPLRLRHEPRPEPSRALDIRRLGSGAVGPRRARHPRGGRAPAGAFARGADHHLLARRLPGVQGATRGARRASSRSACVDRDRRPTSSSSARASPAPRRPSARSTPAFSTIMLERKTLPRHKICSGILSPRGYAFLRENFGEPPDNAFHAPKWVTGVNFLFPNGLQLPMPFIPGPTPHIYRKFADHHVVKESRAEVHEHTEFRDLETGANDVLVKARRVGENGEEVVYRAKYVIAADGPRSEVGREAVPGVPRQHLLVRRRPEVLQGGSRPRPAVVPLHDQLAARLLHLDPRRERLPHRRLHRRARRAVAEGPREGRSSTSRSTTGCASAKKCSRKAASRTSACR